MSNKPKKDRNKENVRLAKAYKVRPENVTFPLEEDAEDFLVNNKSTSTYTPEQSSQADAILKSRGL